MTKPFDIENLWRAFSAAETSADPSTRVGAVLVSPDGAFLAAGANNFPPGVQRNQARDADRDWRLRATVHAEADAILNAGGSAAGATLYCTLFPCANCAALAIRAGISRLVAPDAPTPERWAADMAVAEEILAEAGVEIRRLPLEQQEDRPTTPSP